jgi:hypothetical protein
VNDLVRDNFLQHHGILGQKWGIRRFQPYGQGYDAKKNGKFLGKIKERRAARKKERLKKKEARIDKYESYSKFRKDLYGYAYSKASIDVIKKDLDKLRKKQDKKVTTKNEQRIKENEMMLECFEKYVKDNENRVRKQASEQLAKSPYWVKGNFWSSTPDGVMANTVRHVDPGWFVHTVQKALKKSGAIGAAVLSDAAMRTSASNAAQEAFQNQQMIHQQIVQQQVMQATMDQVQQAAQMAMQSAMQASMQAAMDSAMIAQSHSMGMM